MSTVRHRGEQVRKFIIERVEDHPSDIARTTSEHFEISRQAVNRHLTNLIDEKVVLAVGNTNARTYRLAPLVEWFEAFPLELGLTEDFVWRKVAKSLGQLPDNVSRIWQYGFTEMLNNVIDHSEGNFVSVRLRKTAASSQVAISDDGVGIFKKIQNALGLLDERHSVLELAKGKFTTDPKRHSGEGIFFTSRSFDDFQILSGGVYFTHEFKAVEDWILERPESSKGTYVVMSLHNHTARRLQHDVFDQYADVDFGFTKTVVPVRLAQYGDDNLVSRSQAKRLLARVDRFKTVMLDFRGVETIGQAFADEIFRVFVEQHPEVHLVDVNADAQVKGMIARVRAGAR